MVHVGRHHHPVPRGVRELGALGWDALGDVVPGPIVTDHAAMNYPPFRKDFYCEVPEITKMTDLEVEEYRASLEGIKCKGKNVPRPIKNWVQCGVSSKILHLLKKFNYDKPTPIQAQAMPVIMSGRDAIGIAKTGSGEKTSRDFLP